MYRFLLTPRWLGMAGLALVLAGVMVWLGDWQLDRYRERSAINDRIDGADAVAPVDVRSVLRVGVQPAKGVRYTRVSATGRYDPGHEILVRGRTVNGRVGFEVITPLVLADGSAVLIDRGWVPPGSGSTAAAEPRVPPAPEGEVTVVGTVRARERSTGAVGHRGTRLEVRRIDPVALATALPYPVLGGYVAVVQDPLVPVPLSHENAWQNAGYVVQWFAFAALTLFGYGYLARRQANLSTAASPSSTTP